MSVRAMMRARSRREVNRGPLVVALAGMAALAVSTGIGRFALTPLLPMMQADAGISIIEGSWLAAANYLGYLVGAVIATIQPIRARAALPSGLGVIVVATAAMAATYEVEAWMLLRAIAGLGTAYVFISTAAWSTSVLSTLGRPGLVGVVFSGVGLGIAVTGLVTLALMVAGAGSAVAWIALGTVALAVTPLPLGVVRHGSIGKEGLAAPTRPGRWRPRWIVITLCYGAFGYGYIVPATFLPAMAKQVVADPVVFGWAWPIFGAAAAVSTLLAGRLVAAVPDRTVWVSSYAVMALGVAVPAVVPGVASIAVAALCVGGTFMVSTLVGIREARSLAGDEAPRLIGAMTAAFATAQVAGPSVAGAVAARSESLAPALLSASAVLGVAILGLAWDAQRARAKGAGA